VPNPVKRKPLPLAQDKMAMLTGRRQALAKQGPWMFAKVYLPELLKAQDDIYDKNPKEFDDAKVIIRAGTTVDASDFHHMLYEVAKTPTPTKAREAFVAPRGFAKSTAITIVVLYWAAFQLRQFVLWTSETASQVEELVASIIDEIENNGALREDFPHLLPAVDPKGNYVKFNDRDMVLKSGFRLSARGTRKATRGLRRGANRPDAVICDDAEGEDSVGPLGYPKTRHWLTRVLGPALSPRGDIYWLNTLVEWESVTGAMITQDEDWTRNWNVHHLQAEWYEDEEGRHIDVLDLTYLQPDKQGIKRGDVYVSGDENDLTAGLTHHLLWPEYWPQERIDGFKQEFGLLAYSFELLNKPMSDALKPFKLADMPSVRFVGHKVMREHFPEDDWINRRLVKYVTVIDPAFGGKDYAAVVTVGIFGQDTFCREAWWYRSSDVRTAMVKEAVRQAEYWDSVAIGVESVAAQIMVADETVSQTNRPVIPISPKNKNKLDRAQPVSIRADQGHTFFEMEGPGVAGLRHLLSRFPGPDADDPVDAYVYAVELAHTLRGKMLVVA
jgi:hypothetical protein